MRILIIHHCDSWGGAGVSLRDCCLMLKDKHEITVCLPHIGSVVAEELKSIGDVKLISIESDMAMISAYNGGPAFVTRTFVKNYLMIPECARRVCDLLKGYNFDLVILNSITLSWLCKPLTRMNFKVSVYIREAKPEKHPGFLIEKLLINRYATGVLFISEYDQKVMNFNVPLQAVVRDTICDNDNRYDSNICRRQFGLPENKVLALFMGGTDKLKGYEYAVGAMELINDNNIVLIVAGNTDPMRRIEKENIIYVGLVSQTLPLYCACDFLIFPSIEGHQSRPAFEAGFQSRPVIISDFPHTELEIIDGYNGMTVIPQKSQELAGKIKEIANNPQLRQIMGRNNRDHAVKRHSFSANKKELLAFVERLSHE